MTHEHGQADLVLFNGQIVTINKNDQVHEGVAIQGNKILAVGDSNTVRSYAGPGTKHIDLDGKTVLPGIIDSHTHPGHAAVRYLEINCRDPGIKGIRELQNTIKKRAEELGSGKWVKGGNYNDSKLVEKRQITRWELDEAAANNPVILNSDTGHQSVVNSIALKLAGVTKDTPDPAGGTIDRNPDGEPTGLLYETAQRLVGALVPKYSIEEVKNGLRKVIDQFSEWGITSTHDASGNTYGFRCFQQLNNEGVKKLRVAEMMRSHTEDEDMIWPMLDVGLESGYGNDWLKVISYKIMLDGSGAGGTAAVYTPQHRGTKGLGLLVHPVEELNDLVMKAHLGGIRVSIHAIGDRGIDLALDAIEKAQEERPVPDMRHRIEHNSYCTMNQLKRIKKLGVVPSSSIGYMYDLGSQYSENFGPEAGRWLHPHKTMMKMGIIAGGNSDCPVSYYSPFVQIYAAVTRKTRSGQVVGLEESISVMDAIRVYTWNGAYLSKEETIKGSIEPGKLADLIVIDRDILTCTHEEIKNINVITTIVDGKIIFER